MSYTDVSLSFNEDISPKKRPSDAFLQGKYCSCPSLVPTVKISDAITNCIDLGRPKRGDKNNNTSFRARAQNTDGCMYIKKQNVLSKIDDNEHEILELDASSLSSSSMEDVCTLWNRSFSVPDWLPDCHAYNKIFKGFDSFRKNNYSKSWPEVTKVKKYIGTELEDMSSDEEELNY